MLAIIGHNANDIKNKQKKVSIEWKYSWPPEQLNLKFAAW
jgi:hypothetical protein